MEPKAKTRHLKFSYNWNNKLDCNAFTTLRLADGYKVGEVVEVYLEIKKGEWIFKGKAIIIDKRSMHSNSINEFVARLDTGYSAPECKKIIQRMYKHENPFMDLLLVRYIDKAKPAEVPAS